jgi:hypothetical protein
MQLHSETQCGRCVGRGQANGFRSGADATTVPVRHRTSWKLFYSNAVDPEQELAIRAAQPRMENAAWAGSNFRSLRFSQERLESAP